MGTVAFLNQLSLEALSITGPQQHLRFGLRFQLREERKQILVSGYSDDLTFTGADKTFIVFNNNKLIECNQDSGLLVNEKN